MNDTAGLLCLSNDRPLHLSQDYFQQIISVINDSSPAYTCLAESFSVIRRQSLPRCALLFSCWEMIGNSLLNLDRSHCYQESLRGEKVLSHEMNQSGNLFETEILYTNLFLNYI